MADISTARGRFYAVGSVRKTGDFTLRASGPSQRTTYTQTWSRLGVGGAVRRNGSFSGKTIESLVQVNVSDTLNVQWLEEPVDENFIISADTLRVSLSEVSALHNRIDAVDTLAVRVSEAIALIQVGVTPIVASDTLSVTLTESATVNVSVAVSDTLSTSVTDSATVDTTLVLKSATDTLTVTVNDASLLQVFTGLLAFDVSDMLNVSLTESASASIFVPTKPARIRIALPSPRIRITLL